MTAEDRAELRVLRWLVHATPEERERIAVWLADYRSDLDARGLDVASTLTGCLPAIPALPAAGSRTCDPIRGVFCAKHRCRCSKPLPAVESGP